MTPTLRIAFFAGAIGLAAFSHADTVLTVKAGDPWQGYMNVFELPEGGGGYVFGSAWGTADLRATFSGSTLNLSPNTIAPPNGLADTFWYKPNGTGNKTMEANLYVQKSDGSLSGQNVSFTGTVNSNTLTEHDAIVFIRDWSAGFTSVNEISAPLVDGEPFAIDLDTDPTPGRIVQYGFQVKGANVWVTNVGPFGSVNIAAIPVTQGNPNVNVNPAATWNGFMNVFNLPAPDGDGAFLPGVGGVWTPPDLRATFGGPVLTLAPNNINPPTGLADTFWYQGDGDGNKKMDANMYVEAIPGSLSGLTVNFTGTVLSNTLTSAHTAIAFIKEYAADYSSFTVSSTPLTPGPFNISLAISGNPTTHVQYGFQMIGPNVWKDNAPAFGSVQVANTAVNSFALWIAGQNFSGYVNPDLSPGGDPDGDGKTNLEEFAFNDNPASSTASPRFRARTTTVGGGQALVLTVPVRATPVFTGTPAKTGTADGVEYTIQGSNGLMTFDQAVSEVAPADASGLPAPDPGWSYRSFRLDGDIGGLTPRGPRGFLRARVSSTP
jgi:hypothetical protein